MACSRELGRLARRNLACVKPRCDYSQILGRRSKSATVRNDKQTLSLLPVAGLVTRFVINGQTSRPPECFPFLSLLSFLAVPIPQTPARLAFSVRTPRICLVILAAIAMSAPLAAQDFSTPRPEKGRITGTVIDPNNEIVPGAATVLEGALLTAMDRHDGLF
jgi:hypothetical protein